jgi:hypothetical protein
VTRPGGDDLTATPLSTLLDGELAPLPLEGWRQMTLHGQVDRIGPSSQHPDLVQVEVSVPPAGPPAAPCRRCRGRKVVPDFTHWDRLHGEPTPVPCPECTTCTATALHALAGVVRCTLPAGHYDAKAATSNPHQAAPDRRTGRYLHWTDDAHAATAHASPTVPLLERPIRLVRLNCPTCGSAPVEEDPRLPGVLRCGNCREHLGHGYFDEGGGA